MRLGSIVLAALLAAAMPAAAQDDADNGDAGWHGGAWVTSDYVFRGVSQSQQRPAGQGELYYSFANGLYLGVWGSSVDFIPDGDEDDGVDFEFDPYIGWEFPLNDFLSADVMLIRQIYVDPLPGIDYDYTELEAKLWFGEQWFAHLAWSNDVFATGETGIYVSGGTELPLAETKLRLYAQAGWYDLDDAVDDSYGDWWVGIGYPLGPAELRIEYHDTYSYSDAFADVLGTENLAGERFVATLGYEF